MATVAVLVAWITATEVAAFIGAIAAAAAVTVASLLPKRSRISVSTALLVATALLALVSHGSGVPAILLAIATQFAASLSLPRSFALGFVLATTASVAIGSALQASAEGWVVGAAVLAINAAIFHFITSFWQAIQDQARQAERPRDHQTSLAGATRVELVRIKHEFTLMANELRRETSSRQHAEKQLVEAYRTKEAFLATMSHELRTPLSQIIGFSELIIEEGQENDPVALTDDVERIHQAAMGLFEIIENILDQSRIEAGTAAVAPELIDLFSFVDPLIRDFATLARRRGNTLRLRCAESIGGIVTDRGMLRTVLKNILGNACKFTENGTIRMSVELDLKGVRPTYVFETRDTGIGIHPDDMGRLFKPFQQVDGSRTRRFDGAGLGLAISQHFTAMLGGDLTADSVPGVGSTFTLRLPQEWLDGKQAGIIIRSIGG